MMEEWRDIQGYEGLYQVSDQGKVRSLDRVINTLRGTRQCKGKVLKPCIDPIGRSNVTLCCCKRVITSVPYLVAVAFLGPRPAGHHVCHGPKGLSDNSVSNLRYGTPSSNLLDTRRDGTHGGRAVIRGDGEVFINLHVAAEESKCLAANIWAACNGRQKTSGGFTWKYKEEIR